MSEDQIALARELGSATVHEAAGRIGALPATLRPVDPGMRLAGPAVPVTCLPGDNLWIHRALYAANAGDVLVVATGDASPDWGYWGEILSVAAVARQLGGLVLQGGSRDTDALVGVGFPVFSLGPCIRGTGKDMSSPIGAVGRPVRVGSVVISQGDLVVGDRDGVVVVPRPQIGEALAASVARQHAEDEIMASLRQGASTLGIYGLGVK